MEVANGVKPLRYKDQAGPWQLGSPTPCPDPMPSLLPREITPAASFIKAGVLRPSPSDHRVGIYNQVTRLHMGSLTLLPAALPRARGQALVLLFSDTRSKGAMEGGVQVDKLRACGQ